MSTAADKYERLVAEYTALFGVAPELNGTSFEVFEADMEEAIRLKRPIPADSLPADAET